MGSFNIKVVKENINKEVAINISENGTIEWILENQR